jgi:hypothetical protein
MLLSLGKFLKVYTIYSTYVWYHNVKKNFINFFLLLHFLLFWRHLYSLHIVESVYNIHLQWSKLEIMILFTDYFGRNYRSVFKMITKSYILYPQGTVDGQSSLTCVRIVEQLWLKSQDTKSQQDPKCNQCVIIQFLDRVTCQTYGML